MSIFSPKKKIRAPTHLELVLLDLIALVGEAAAQQAHVDIPTRGEPARHRRGVRHNVWSTAIIEEDGGVDLQ